MRAAFNWQEWRLVAKLDPDKNLSEKQLAMILKKNPDAVIVGGTQGINLEKTARMINSITDCGYNGPLIQEVSELHAVAPGVAGHIIPVVLNSTDVRWLTGAHMEAVRYYGDMIDWQKVLPVGYIICNPSSAAAAKTGALPVSVPDAAAYASIAVNILKLPVLYVEYSGTYGDPEMVRAVTANAGSAKVFYGGGINSPDRLKVMLNLAHTVVVGNALYEDPDISLTLFPNPDG